MLPLELSPVTPSTINRRLAAIAFADIAGFSRLMALDEIETLRRWKALRSEIIEPHIARNRGRIAEIAGDAVLAEFPSVVNAVRWAADVQRTQRGAQGEKDPFTLQLRIGINIEDVIDEDGILQGDGVNIAARIHQAAEPGQIVVTATVRDYVINRLPVVFHDLGTPPMKIFNRPIRVFAVEWTEEKKTSCMCSPICNGRHGRRSRSFRFGRSVAPKTTDISETRSPTNSFRIVAQSGLYVIARNSTLRYRDRRRTCVRSPASSMFAICSMVPCNDRRHA